MKKLLTLAMLLVMSLSTYAQKDVTKFLGIPVDGTKSEMIRKLKAKGFTSSSYNKDVLEGEFNGMDAKIWIQTNRNLVWRIIVSYSNLSEQNAKTRYNNLCYQFNNNPKYFSSTSDFTIPESEDISYEMSVREKKYQACFFQRPDLDILKDDYSSYLESNFNENKYAWITIIQNTPSDYGIAIYYENGYNIANGEDL